MVKKQQYSIGYIVERLTEIIEAEKISEGLNVIENWNNANRFIFYGKNSKFAT